MVPYLYLGRYLEISWQQMKHLDKEIRVVYHGISRNLGYQKLIFQTHKKWIQINVFGICLTTNEKPYQRYSKKRWIPKTLYVDIKKY